MLCSPSLPLLRPFQLGLVILSFDSLSARLTFSLFLPQFLPQDLPLSLCCISLDFVCLYLFVNVFDSIHPFCLYRLRCSRVVDEPHWTSSLSLSIHPSVLKGSVAFNR